MSDKKTPQRAPGDLPEAGNKQFVIQKVYVKDLSFEAPGAPDVFTRQWEPQVNVELNTSGKKVSDQVHEVILSVTVTAKLGDTTAFIVEVQQAGIFTITGLNEGELGHALGSFCPNILFPFLRETVSDVVTKGGFPQLLLAPVNFDALYAQHMAQKQKGTGKSEAVH